MNLLSILFGACLASLVWALVMMRYIEHDMKDFEKMTSLMHDYFKSDEELRESQSHLIEAIKDSADMIREHNMEFKLEVLNLFEKWGKYT